MGRCESLDALKSFPWSAAQLSGVSILYFHILSSLRAHQLALRGDCNCWWLWHPLLTDEAGHNPFLLVWFIIFMSQNRQGAVIELNRQLINSVSFPIKHIINKEQKDDVCVLTHVQLFMTLWMIACLPLCPWDFSGKTTGMGCHFLFQGIFPTQGSNPHLLLSSALAERFFTPKPSGKSFKIIVF